MMKRASLIFLLSAFYLSVTNGLNLTSFACDQINNTFRTTIQSRLRSNRILFSVFILKRASIPKNLANITTLSSISLTFPTALANFRQFSTNVFNIISTFKPFYWNVLKNFTMFVEYFNYEKI